MFEKKLEQMIWKVPSTSKILKYNGKTSGNQMWVGDKVLPIMQSLLAQRTQLQKGATIASVYLTKLLKSQKKQHALKAFRKVGPRLTCSWHLCSCCRYLDLLAPLCTWIACTAHSPLRSCNSSLPGRDGSCLSGCIGLEQGQTSFPAKGQIVNT